ncbi:BamA/TamA family outer membrane protein [Alteriqipengyuania flavescens]|uniref:autotransporter assembly complex protein TamA n=1 Tax=Alteriqipengyuania flavescens TaxID=3053610 RepID=UPI0025B60415|nr:BamA/TamA family outer membrane protein [Alteriqipengyuania flavescens]WJY19102.1 BamA/TamA family outer membrane protein [Alteriqipengyuania flavescens]WJY25043.1 BamA/TamA family outer membrane protein [Alteriqipengyuania flavescens]
MALAATASPALAQDRDTSAELEELIPDSAIDNPDGWAGEGVPAENAAPDALPPLAADAPLDDLPEITVPWPDEIELADVPDLEPPDDIQFAENPFEVLPVLEDGFEVRVSDTTTLVFPSERSLFPEQDEFIDRFQALSQVEALDSDEDSLAQLAARARADEELLIRLMRIYGYYDGEVLRSVGGISPGEEAASLAEGAVRFDVLPGPQYTIGAVDLGELAQADDSHLLRDAFEIRAGDPVLQDKIVEEQFDLDTALGANGYAFAEIDAPELLIDHARDEGDLTMIVRPNGKYNFGVVTSDRPDFLSGNHLGDIARFDPGDLYTREDELDLRRAILATGLVSSVTITKREVVAPQPGQPGTVDLDVGITPAPVRTLAGSIGYGSQEGFKIAASWEHRNLFPPEGSLRVRGILGTQEQLLGVTFRRNNVAGRDRILTIDAYASTIDTVAYDRQAIALTGVFERISTLLYQKPLTWGVGAELLATQESAVDVDGNRLPRETYFVGSVFGRTEIDTTDSLLDPRKGFRLGGFVAPEISRNNDIKTNSFYVRTEATGSYYQPVSEKVVAAGRFRLASINGAPLEAIAPSRRLYAGGGSSVRGYGYQAIGPITADGVPTGGLSAFELSAEARITTPLLNGLVEVVPFVDAGTVARGTTPDFDEIKIGVGIGARYKTGFGPIRVDVGVPLNPGEFDSSFAVYVGLGQAF